MKRCFMSFCFLFNAEEKKVSPCCVAVSRAAVDEPIIDFKFQAKSLPCVRAIIFVTAEKQYCIDPRQSWAREKINELVQRRKNSTMTPTSVSPRLTATISQYSTDSN
ncbi:C-C motif chemokine 5-like [Astyanax mexicanus]|uniref:C-C motif chemokine 5-like n=2 Tax=Astyanax mexicanus TaxID=7994 RepID=A0A8T2MS99_ASTMX|nr:C-C motif chemokine 5-like [Astyanax mexicanus]KAG9283471.1 C-C motif chemokine 5-like [Astyanax mexicanus]